MCKRPSFAILLGLTLAMPYQGRADEKAPITTSPLLCCVSPRSIKLRGDFHYLAEIVGQAEAAKQLEELFKSKVGDKVLDAIDPKKPIGAYGWDRLRNHRQQGCHSCARRR